MDLRGKPTRECLCGCPIFKVRCKFDAEGNISMWFVDAECAECGALLTAPTPVDED